jgi:hypothetical protein
VLRDGFFWKVQVRYHYVNHNPKTLKPPLLPPLDPTPEEKQQLEEA